MRGILAAGAAAVLASGTWASGAWAEGCDVPLDAAMRLNDTPYHMRLVSTDEGRDPEVSELVSTADATYVKTGSTWRPGPKQDLSLQDVDAAGEGLSCKLARRESSGGTMADVWQVEDTSDPDAVKHQTVWIASDSGRVLRLEAVVEEDGEPISRVTAEIDYDNVTPPQ